MGSGVMAAHQSWSMGEPSCSSLSTSNRSDAPRPTTSRAPTWPPFDLDGQVEQLCLKAVNDGSYEVACIPFSAYGIALGDVVLLNNDDYVIEVVRNSWHRTLRLFSFPICRPPLSRRPLTRSRPKSSRQTFRVSGTAHASSPSMSRRTPNPPNSSQSWRQQSTPATPSGSGLTPGRSSGPRDRSALPALPTACPWCCGPRVRDLETMSSPWQARAA
ncbi:DUF4265 domain-containing protein [Streptomyces sp. NPDC054952]